MTEESFNISHHLNCDDRYIIYLLTCKQCLYTGETTESINGMVYGIITSPTLWNLIGKPLYRDFSSPGQTNSSILCQLR